MKILVTGSGTLLGKTIIERLSNKYNIIGLYNKSKLKKNKIKYIKVDLEKKFNINQSFDILIHCASAVPSFGYSDSKVMKINFFGFKRLLKFCKKFDCKKIVLISSFDVYGTIKANFITEKTKFNKPNNYGISKIKMEKALKNYCEKYHCFSLILRCPGIVGKNSKHNFISRSLIQIKKYKKIKINNPNLMFNNIIHVKTISNIIENYISKKNSNEIFNLGSKNKMKFKEIFSYIFKKMNYKKNISFTKNNNKGFNIKLNNKLLKNYPIISTKKTLEMFVDDNRSN